MQTIPERIRIRREQLRLSPQQVARAIGMYDAAYCDLESDPDEWEEVVEIGQLLRLSDLLQTPLLALIGEQADEVRDRLSFDDLACLIKRRITECGLVEARLGWDLTEFCQQPMVGLNYPVAFLKIVGEDVGFDWRGPLWAYDHGRSNARTT